MSYHLFKTLFLSFLFIFLSFSCSLAYLGEPVGHRFDSSKLKDLGFEYEHTLEDMFDGAIKSCREKGLL